MINKKLNKKEVYSCTYRMTYNSDSVIRNKCGTIIIFYHKGIKNYTHIVENLFNLYAISAYFKLNFSL